jgi:outer membrane protein assembly factor BamD (BamD/ComL family)
MIASAVLLAPRIRQGLQSLALALLMAGITTAAVKVFGWKWRSAAAPAAVPSVRKAPSRDLSQDQRLVAVSAEPEPRAAPASSLPSAVERHLSASEMFAAAADARTSGNTPEAIRVCKQIEEFFPNSEEGKSTHLALGVLYLQQNQAELALQEFAMFRRVGSPEAKAEAYFGQAQALRKLARFEDEQTVLTELLQSYPRSAYVAAARIRLAELQPDAAVK